MQKKQYQTAGRTRLLHYMAEQTVGAPQTAEEIYHGLQCAGHAVAQSSVYRRLTALVQAGEVKRHNAIAPNERARFEYVGHTHHCDAHFHLHCLQCGGVTHLECGCGGSIANQLLEKHGFHTDCGRSVFYGVCAACARKGGAAQ